MKTINIAVYTFDELSKIRQEKLLKQYREDLIDNYFNENNNTAWNQVIIDKVERKLSDFGFEDVKIYTGCVSIFGITIPNLSECAFQATLPAPKLLRTIKSVKGFDASAKGYKKELTSFMKEQKLELDSMSWRFLKKENKTVYDDFIRSVYEKFRELMKEAIEEMKVLKKYLLSDEFVKNYFINDSVLFFANGEQIQDEYILELCSNIN